MEEHLGAWCFPWRRFGAALCLQGSVGCGKLVHSCSFNPDVVCWRCHTCAESTWALLALSDLNSFASISTRVDPDCV